MKKLLIRSVERVNIIDYRLNEGNNNIRGRRNNKRRRNYINNQENNSEEESATFGSEFGGERITMTSGTASIFLDGILTKGEYARIINNLSNTNYERVQVEYVIDNDTKS